MTKTNDLHQYEREINCVLVRAHVDYAEDSVYIAVNAPSDRNFAVYAQVPNNFNTVLYLVNLIHLTARSMQIEFCEDHSDSLINFFEDHAL